MTEYLRGSLVVGLNLAPSGTERFIMESTMVALRHIISFIGDIYLVIKSKTICLVLEA
jgi:hypothetical protein